MNTETQSTKAKIAKNFIYNLSYQILSLITPFITAPYVSRVLGSAGVGRYSFAHTNSNYFILLGSLGFMYYAQREIAALQGDRHKQSVVFWEIIIARFISVGISVAFYLLLILNNAFKDYTTLMWLLLIIIVAAAFDVTFLFQGNDDFGIIALRNTVIRVIGIVCIFVFVKNENDLITYALLQCVIEFGSKLSLWGRIKKYVDPVPIYSLNPRKHFIPTLRLFIPTVAMSVYTMLDRTLIGVLIPGETNVLQRDGSIVIKKLSDVENGFYEQSEKIVKMAMTVFTSLSTVLISRNSSDLAKGDIKSFQSNIYLAIRFLFFIGTPIMFGLAALSQNFTPWFFGPGYEKVPYLIMIFSPITMIIGLSNILGRQYLIPQKRDTAFTIAICCGALVNLSLNLILIPLFYSYSAAIASVIAELSVTAIMYFMSRKDLSILKVMASCWKEILASAIMFTCVYFTQTLMSPSIMHSIILVSEGIIVYVIMLVILKDSTMLHLLKMVRSRLKRE